MTTYTAVVGDTNDTIDMYLNGVDTLAGVNAVEAHVWTDTIASVDLTGSVIDAATRHVRINLGSWITNAAAAAYHLEVETIATGPVTRTWPSGQEKDILIVTAQGA